MSRLAQIALLAAVLAVPVHASASDVRIAVCSEDDCSDPVDACDAPIDAEGWNKYLTATFGANRSDQKIALYCVEWCDPTVGSCSNTCVLPLACEGQADCLGEDPDLPPLCCGDDCWVDPDTGWFEPFDQLCKPTEEKDGLVGFTCG